MKKPNHTQKRLCELAQLDLAARNHDKMAEMQEKAGNHERARDSRRVAYSRRLAHDMLSADADCTLEQALSYGESRSLAGI